MPPVAAANGGGGERPKEPRNKLGISLDLSITQCATIFIRDQRLLYVLTLFSPGLTLQGETRCNGSPALLLSSFS